ncbi:4-alpha-glucanotransferase [Corynebacterium capitovis DSM 44611]|uniref:4-alpha-glucanotransferase n=1 Tax=Corynebacterium capitovis TaxID=131081 RepID=UPI00035F4B4B|nr:4-alpha-glucanotransferase [Corynebacterium capitovis]WKD57240.1 4-alpha-glucanotransferase [Corynebacterium capitovis DSM 44611]
MTNADLLNELASSYGFGLQYWASNGQLTEPPRSSYVALLRALGLPLTEQADGPGGEELEFYLTRRRQELATAPLPPCVVATEGQEAFFPVHVHDGQPAHVWIQLEDGSAREAYQDENWNPPVSVDGVTWGEATFHVPGDLPLGWHELHLESEGIDTSCTLVVVPNTLQPNQEYLRDPAYGVMAQLYSVRSTRSWGIGDFGDLGELAETVAARGADYLLINPVHAAEPLPPVENSPYLPTSRRFVNPIYIAVEDVPEWAALDSATRGEVAELAGPLKAANRSAEPINRDLIFGVKLDVLRELFYLAESDDARRAAFDAFISEEGEGLREFGKWCARQAQAADSGRHVASQAPEEADFVARFYMWLQFVADEQRRAAQERARAAGMRIGIVTDLAVGVHPGGADAHTLADVLVADASVGAPPDQYTQQGQDWSQPPWNPAALAAAGYRPWRDLLRTVLRHSGGVRVDHILGLFRLFWIPRYGSPTEGAYMNYDHTAMVGILALEAQRAGAIVVGEDLGTYEPWVQEVLRDTGILGTSVLWFESAPPGNSPQEQAHYRHLALSSVGTHDLPPTAGYLRGAHNELRVNLGLVKETLEELNASDAAWHAAVLDSARETGAFRDTEFADTVFKDLPAGSLAGFSDAQIADLVVGLNRFIAGTPSALTCVNLVDMVGDTRIQNQPGTNAAQYANWCIPLCDATGAPVLLDELSDVELFQRVADAALRGH